MNYFKKRLFGKGDPQGQSRTLEVIALVSDSMSHLLARIPGYI